MTQRDMDIIVGEMVARSMKIGLLLGLVCGASGTAFVAFLLWSSK